MRRTARTAVVVASVVAVAAVMVIKRAGMRATTTEEAQMVTGAAPGDPAAAGLPRLLDLGATACIPCRMMTPILAELRREYAGRLRVDVVDVWKYPVVGEQYQIDGIPTQIFFDGSGKELYRHAGFLGKADILAKWKELGLDLSTE